LIPLSVLPAKLQAQQFFYSNSSQNIQKKKISAKHDTKEIKMSATQNS
jgi:hypothetical protein